MATAAILHDIGKSKLTSEILYKTTALDEEEFRLIQDHPRTGAELLLAQEDASALDIAASWGHHQRWDGGGYPARPSWVQVNPVIDLLHIIDVFEALTAIRPYKMALTPQQAFSIMINDQGAFESNTLALFIRHVGIYPPGTYIELSNGHIGMVTGVGDRLDRPRVRIVELESGKTLDKDKQREVDLGKIAPDSLYVAGLLLNYLDE
jgi:HD-GYP domain-containing protein (c-di-GMP phosphodiesterase class II)